MEPLPPNIRDLLESQDTLIQRAVNQVKSRVRLFVSIYLYIYPTFHLSNYRFFHLSIFPSTHLFVYPLFHLSIYLVFIYPSFHLSIFHLSIYRYFYLSIYPSFFPLYPFIHISIYLFFTVKTVFIIFIFQTAIATNIVYNNKVVWSKTYGALNLSAAVPKIPSSSTIFPVASVSKVFTVS